VRHHRESVETVSAFCGIVAGVSSPRWDMQHSSPKLADALTLQVTRARCGGPVRCVPNARRAVTPAHRSESAAGIVTMGAAAVNDSDSVAEEVKASAEAPRGERESKDVDGDRGDSRAKFSSDGDSGARESFPTSPNESVQETQVRVRPASGVVCETQGCARARARF
jgi:hypothetical protein